MKATVILIIIRVLGTVPKTLAKGLKELEIGERTDIILTTELLRLSCILRRVLET